MEHIYAVLLDCVFRCKVVIDAYCSLVSLCIFYDLWNRITRSGYLLTLYDILFAASALLHVAPDAYKPPSGIFLTTAYCGFTFLFYSRMIDFDYSVGSISEWASDGLATVIHLWITCSRILLAVYCIVCGIELVAVLFIAVYNLGCVLVGDAAMMLLVFDGFTVFQFVCEALSFLCFDHRFIAALFLFYYGSVVGDTVYTEFQERHRAALVPHHTIVLLMECRTLIDIIVVLVGLIGLWRLRFMATVAGVLLVILFRYLKHPSKLTSLPVAWRPILTGLYYTTIGVLLMQITNITRRF